MKSYADLTLTELEGGARVLRVAEKIFEDRFSDSEGENIITSLLRNNFEYDGKNYEDYLNRKGDIKYCQCGLIIYYKENFEGIRAENNGEFEKDGIKFALIEQAYADMDFKTWESVFKAKAIDEKGNLYKIIWKIKEIYKKYEEIYKLCKSYIEDKTEEKLQEILQKSKLLGIESEYPSEIINEIESIVEDFSECCDWEHPYRIELIEEVIY
jgi:hypothetical protein